MSSFFSWLNNGVDSWVISVRQCLHEILSIERRVLEKNTVEHYGWCWSSSSWSGVLPKISCSHLRVVLVSIIIETVLKFLSINLELSCNERCPLSNNLIVRLSSSSEDWILVIKGKLDVLMIVIAKLGISQTLICEVRDKLSYLPRTMMIRQREVGVSNSYSVLNSAIEERHLEEV